MATASIVITTHNRPRLLPRAVESARAAGKEVEVVVVDDASSDDTARVCSELEGINYVRVERNQKVAGARNIGVLNSTGEFISFLDDDDVRLPGTLDLQIEALRTRPDAGLIYGQALVGQGPRFYPQSCPDGDVFLELLAQNFIPCGTAVFRRSCLLRVGLLDQSIPGIDDWDLWLRIADLYPIMVLDQIVLQWNRSNPASGQGTSHASELVRFSDSQLRDSWPTLSHWRKASEVEHRIARRRFSHNMAAHLAFETVRALRSRELRQASANLFAAAQLFPLWSIRVAVRPSNVRRMLALASSSVSRAS